MGRAMESDAKDGVAANNDYTDCEEDREPKKTGIDDILVDYFHDSFQDYFKIYGIVCRGFCYGTEASYFRMAFSAHLNNFFWLRRIFP